MDQKKICPLRLLFCGYSRVIKGDYRHLSMVSHQFWQGDLCISGTAEIVFQKYTLTVHPYDILIIPPGVPHMFRYISQTERFCLCCRNECGSAIGIGCISCSDGTWNVHDANGGTEFRGKAV